MQNGPEESLNFANLVKKADTVNPGKLNALFSESDDSTFLMKFSSVYPAAEKRLIDKLGSWGTCEQTVLAHLSKQGYVPATRMILLTGNYQYHYHELHNLAKSDHEFALSIYSHPKFYLTLEDWVKIAKTSAPIAKLLIMELYRFIVYDDKPKRNRFSSGGYWSQSDSDYKQIFKENLFLLLSYHPTLAQDLFDDGFKIYYPDAENRLFHRLCLESNAFLHLVFLNANCFNEKSLIELAEKYPETFLNCSEHILACPKFENSKDLEAVAERIKDIMEVIESAPQVSFEEKTLTAAFDQFKLSETEAQGNVSSASITDKKLKRRASF